MPLLFNISALIVSICFLILLCVIVQKNIVSEVIPAVGHNKKGQPLNTQNNPYGDQYDSKSADHKSKEELRKNLQYVSDCPDYWTPYYDENGGYTCVSDNPYYNNKMEATLDKAATNYPNKVKKINLEGLSELDALNFDNNLTPGIINNMNESDVVSQNNKLFYIPNSSKHLSSGKNKHGWDSKCHWTQKTCLPWSGINSSHTQIQDKKTGKIKECKIPTTCLNQNVEKPTKPKPGVDTTKRPIYFYNYSLGNDAAVNTNYIPNLYDTNLLQDRSVKDQRATGLLNDTSSESPQICGYTAETCQKLVNSNPDGFVGNFHAVQNGPGGCFKYGNDYYFNNTSQDCTKQPQWKDRIPMTKATEI